MPTEKERCGMLELRGVTGRTQGEKMKKQSSLKIKVASEVEDSIKMS